MSSKSKESIQLHWTFVVFDKQWWTTRKYNNQLHTLEWTAILCSASTTTSTSSYSTWSTHKRIQQLRLWIEKDNRRWTFSVHRVRYFGRIVSCNITVFTVTNITTCRHLKEKNGARRRRNEPLLAIKAGRETEEPITFNHPPQSPTICPAKKN